MAMVHVVCLVNSRAMWSTHTYPMHFCADLHNPQCYARRILVVIAVTLAIAPSVPWQRLDENASQHHHMGDFLMPSEPNTADNAPDESKIALREEELPHIAGGGLLSSPIGLSLNPIDTNR